MADSTTHVPQVPDSAGALDMINALLDAASPAMMDGRNAVLCVGFTFAILGGKEDIAGEPTAKANETFDCSAFPSDTLYLYKPTAGGPRVLTDTEPSGWPGPIAEGVALYTLTTGTASITGYVDHRMGGGGSVAGAAVVAALASALGLDSITRVGNDIIFTDGTDTFVATLGP